MERRLRSDLLINKNENDNQSCSIIDPTTKEIFEFGVQECFLIHEIRSSYNSLVLIKKFESKFNRKDTKEFFKELLEELENCNLLENSANAKDAEKKINIENRFNHWSIFCPQLLLDNLSKILHYFKFLVKAIPFFCIFAIFTLISNNLEFREDLAKVATKFNFVEHLIYTLFTLNLITIIFKGCIARYYKLETPSFGIMLAYGIIPRFDIPIDIPPTLSKKQKLWLYSTSILVRICLICFGVLLWSITRTQGTTIPIWCSALVLYSVMTLLFVANPLLGADGYRFLSTYFNSPNLRKNANRSLKYIFFKPPEVISRYTESKLSLLFYASASIIFLILLIVFVGYTLARWLEAEYKGFGIAVFIFLIAYLILRIKFLSIKKKQMKTDRRKMVDEKRTNIQEVFSDKKSRNKGENISFFSMNISKTYKYLLWLALILLMFLPYQYEPGGNVSIQPILQNQIYIESTGIMKYVYFNGGEWLDKETIIAEMDNAKQKNDIKLKELEIDKKLKDIETLKTTPSKEEIDLAKALIESARVKSQYSKDNYSRVNELYKKQSMTLVEKIEAQKQSDLDYQDFLVKLASLLSIENEINIYQVESQKVELEILRQELDYLEVELKKTQIRMPSDGTIATMNLKNNLNKYFEHSQLFIDLEDNRQVQVEIKIPEADASFVKIDDSIKFRPLSNSTFSYRGKVKSVYPQTESTDYGQTLTVICVLPNTDLSLKTGMTGYAKLEGKEMFVISAFSRSVLNFMFIEIWSWLP